MCDKTTLNALHCAATPSPFIISILHIKASLHMVFRCSLQVLQWSKPTSPEMILASRVPFLVSSFWVQCDPPLLIVPRPLARANIGAGDRHAWNYELASPESPKRKPH